MIVDTIVQEKAVAHPADARLLEVARAKIPRLGKRAGIALKMTYEREGKLVRLRAARYAHANKQFRRMKRVLRRQRAILGVLLREISRKLAGAEADAKAHLQPWLDRAETIGSQRPMDSHKLYALSAPQVDCIGKKGKARKPYEFGVKTSLAVTHESGLVVGARTFPGNPYDGHTLAAQLEQTTALLPDIGVKPTTAVVDLGYRGVDDAVAPVQVIHRGKAKTLTAQQEVWLRRRQPIEPVICHTKADHRMDRGWLKGAEGDAIHAVLCAADFNPPWLLRAIAARMTKALVFPLAALIMLVRTLLGWLDRGSKRSTAPTSRPPVTGLHERHRLELQAAG